jgi:hypothetical protein
VRVLVRPAAWISVVTGIDVANRLCGSERGGALLDAFGRDRRFFEQVLR